MKTTISQYKIVPTKSEEVIEKKKITNSKDAYETIKKFWYEDIQIYESFFILLLNKANITIGWAKISQGGVTGTVADIKIILKYAVDSLASGIIIAHNHPSGNLYPSTSDDNVTNKVKDSLKLIDSQLIDHIILSPNDEYYSYGDEGKI